jgi:signal transduction histidine kinase
MVPETSEAELVERLAGHRLLGDAPHRELAWLASHASVRRLRVGEVISSPRSGPIEEMFILLSGRIGMYVERAGVPRKVIGWTGGDVTGLLPYSRLTTSPGTARAEEPTDVLLVGGGDLPELTRECPVITTRLVREMLDRARHFQQDSLHDARMASLGRLAAGLAHELDNPASAVIRSAKLLISSLDEADGAARDLGRSAVSPEQYGSMQALRDRCLGAAGRPVRAPLEQARHEEEIADWLAARGLEVACAEPLADTPITIGMLDDLAGSLDPASLQPALRWVAAGCAIRELAAELDESASRISHLVKAVKGFSQLDTAASPRPVDIELGLNQTLAVHRSKARGKAVSVTITAEPDLPPVRAVAGELNQVWSNLLDNALDAVAEGGAVRITARRRGAAVVVGFADDGPGVPAEIQEHVFEPFFTTKEVGKGTGLGLDIVRRLVERHDGVVELSSAPGHTEFRVRMPIDDRAGPGGGG